MPIVAADSVSGFFHEAVGDALKSRHVEASGGATTYLVVLLSDFAKPSALAEATLDRPLAFLLDEALHTVGPAERFERLRTLGDGVLYTCGFFGDHFEARGVDQKYLVGIGSAAYGNASSMLRPAPTDGDVYGELAGNFSAFVDVIAEVANATIAKGMAGPRGLVKLYERWLKTKSGAIEQTLSAHGFVTRGGGKGVLS
jgi:hypothetical protein